MKIDRITHQQYTILVDGNGGEEQLIIMASPGRDGRWGLLIAQATVDGETRVFFNKRVRSDLVEPTLRSVIKHWDAPNADFDDTVDNVNQIVEAFQRNWDFDPDAADPVLVADQS